MHGEPIGWELLALRGSIRFRRIRIDEPDGGGLEGLLLGGLGVVCGARAGFGGIWAEAGIAVRDNARIATSARLKRREAGWCGVPIVTGDTILFLSENPTGETRGLDE